MDKRIKVAYLIRPAAGGMKTHLLTLLAGLNRDLFDPLVIAPPKSPLCDALEELEIPCIALPLVGELNPLKDVLAALQLRAILREERPDILHMHSAKAGLVGRLAVMSRRRPKTVLTMHSFVFDERVGAKRRKLVGAIERYFTRYTDKIITVSQALKDELVSEMQLSPELIDVIYNGIDFHDAPKQSSPHPRVGTVARLAPQKGVEHFIRAAALVLAERPDVTFIIAGDGPYKASLKALAESLSISEGIEFIGFQSDVPSLLATLDIFVLSSDRETFGLSVVEAMAQGVPVVATRVGGIPEIVDGITNGLLAEPANAHDIAEKILHLINDQDMAERIAASGNRSVRARFSAARMVAATETLYTSLMTPRRKARR